MPVRALPVHRLGGLEFHTLDLANALQALGHEMLLLTSRHPEGLCEETLASGVRVRYLEQGRPGDYTVPFFREMNELVEQLDCHEHFDIIHTQEFAGLLFKAHPGRFVCTIHGTMFSEVPLDRRYFRRLGLREKLRVIWRYKPRLALHPLFVRMLAHPDRLVVDSDYTRRELLRINPSLRPAIHLVPLGVDLARYDTHNAWHLPEPGKPFTLIYLGRIQRMKGFLLALEAMSLLRDRGVHCRLLMAGAGEDAQMLRDEISCRGLHDTVSYLGRIPQEELSDFLAQGQLFLFPDQTQPAFGLVAVEAMLHGLPVLAARSGAIPESVTEEVGWVYSPWDSQELAVLIQEIMEHPEQLAAKASRVQSHALQHTAARMAQGVQAVYDSLKR